MKATSSLAVSLLGLLVTATTVVAQSIPSPEAHFGHAIGADRTLVGWDGIVEYMQLVGRRSDRVNAREVGTTTLGRPFLLLEISSPATLRDIDQYKRLQQRLYFQDHRPGQDPDVLRSERDRDDLFARHKAVVLITATIHSTEVGAAQMSLELVHHLATDNSPRTRKILDNTIFLLVPSLNPDGQDMVAEWYDRYVGTEYEAGAMPWLYHAYVGHDNNRDMYMFSQQETRLIGDILYKEWFPSIWLDEHQMGSTGPRIFTMPATDPINPNVHPLIYTLNGVYGQAQAAALEAAGKVGIAYDYVYTNFWPGAMAWTGWWHNQVGMLTEVASVRIATPTEQDTEALGVTTSGPRGFGGGDPAGPLPRPRDTQPRTSYPRPWLGGTWTLRDIIDYELIVSMALLETAADTRDQLLRQIHEVNRSTILEFQQGHPTSRENAYGAVAEALRSREPASGRRFAGHGGAAGTPYAVVIDQDQHDPPTVAKLLQTLQRGGVIIERARGAFQAGDSEYAAGTYVIRLGQVFGRYAKEMLEVQTYPEVRATPQSPPQPPYDVTAWSLGMQMGVDVTFVDRPFETSLERVADVGVRVGGVTGTGDVFVLPARYNDALAVVNAVWQEDGRVRRAAGPLAAATATNAEYGTWVIEGVARSRMEALARQYGVTITALPMPDGRLLDVPRPRIAVYQSWGSNMDEGWTRWLLEAYGFAYTTLHPQDIRAAGGAEVVEMSREVREQWPAFVSARTPGRIDRTPLASRFDVILFTHESANSIMNGRDARTIPEAYRGGIGEAGLAALRTFVDAGGSVVALGSATELLINYWPIPVKNLAAGLDEDAFLIPGSVVNLQADPTHPLAWGMPPTSYGYFIRSPFFTLTDGFASQKATVALRYPNTDLRASGWLRGGEYLAGHAAAVQVDFRPTAVGARGGRLVLLGLRPQHRVQTHATFKVLFNALTRATDT
ncbi:MAG TPA: M14 metallopeptidase family protein [Gemmatimonadales bacterium]